MTGAHRWGDRYDRQLLDVFAVQDEVARAIVAILAAHVNRAETERALLKTGKPVRNLPLTRERVLQNL